MENESKAVEQVEGKVPTYTAPVLVEQGDWVAHTALGLPVSNP